MADKKITQLTELTEVADDDFLAVVDTSATVTKKIRKDNLFSGLLPTAAIIQYGATSEPDGWLFCNGQAVSRTTYSALFAAIGVSYGVGDGSLTFNVPDYRGRVAVGFNASDSSFDALGEVGGEKAHTLTKAEMPSHAHGLPQSPHAHGVGDPGHSHGLSGMNNPNGDGVGVEWTIAYEGRGGGVHAAGTGIWIGGAYANIGCDFEGGSAAHNNLQPYQVSHFIIKT